MKSASRGATRTETEASKVSQNEVETFRKLLKVWSEDKRVNKASDAESKLLRFLDVYQQPIISALQLAAR